MKKNDNLNPIGECFHCEKPIRFKDKYCAYCGKANVGWIEPEPTLTSCGNCHAQLEAGDKYCRICGTKAGEGEYAPYQDLMECIYGPMPIPRKHICKNCGYEWTTCLMIDDEKYCPQCGMECYSKAITRADDKMY